MSFRRSTALAPFQRNAMLQLIAVTGVGYVLYQLILVCFVVYTPHSSLVQGSRLGALSHSKVDPVIGLAPLSEYGRYWWTVLTYGWAHHRFWEWLSNMVWVYTFGSIVQSLVGYRQVIPVFVYGLTAGGVASLLSQLGGSPYFSVEAGQLMGAGAGMMAIAAAAVTFAPRYRIYLGEQLSIPILLVFGIFIALNFASYAQFPPMLVLFAGGLLTGFVYGILMKRGYRPGAWVYNLVGRLNDRTTPDPLRARPDGRRSRVLQGGPGMRNPRNTTYKTQQQRVDDILEKIHQRGYNSLTQEEKDVLLRASQETKE